VQVGVRMKWLLLLLMHLNEMLIMIQVVIVVQRAIRRTVELVLGAVLIAKMMDSVHVRHQSIVRIVCFLVFIVKCVWCLIWLINAGAIARFV